MDYDRENVTLTFTALRVQRMECRLVSNGKAIYSIDCSKSGGKDKRTDQWKPSSWFSFKTWDTAAANVKKGDRISGEAWPSTEEWTDKDGKKHSKQVWNLTRLVVLGKSAPAAPADDNSDIPF